MLAKLSTEKCWIPDIIITAIKLCIIKEIRVKLNMFADKFKVYSGSSMSNYISILRITMEVFTY